MSRQKNILASSVHGKFFPKHNETARTIDDCAGCFIFCL